MALPFPDRSFQAVTISFGLRNMSDRHRCLTELRRVLTDGGRLLILEFSQPKPWLRPFYFFYLRKVLPLVAGVITGDRAAYVYLNNTIQEFPGVAARSMEIKNAGFSEVRGIPLSLGMVALHEATK